MSTTFRCPVCLFTMSDGNYSKKTLLKCARCERQFSYHEALPAAAEQAAPEPKPAVPGATTFVVISFIALVAACLVTILFGKAIDGMRFLKEYLIFGAILLVGQWLVRLLWQDLLRVSVVAFLIFEAVGLTRLVHGYYFLNMRRFGFLLVLMVIGGVIQFFRVRHLSELNQGSSSWSNCSSTTSCSSGSSCGGGGSGCGGGGCGGCGGS